MTRLFSSVIVEIVRIMIDSVIALILTCDEVLNEIVRRPVSMYPFMNLSQYYEYAELEHFMYPNIIAKVTSMYFSTCIFQYGVPDIRYIKQISEWKKLLSGWIVEIYYTINITTC